MFYETTDKDWTLNELEERCFWLLAHSKFGCVPIIHDPLFFFTSSVHTAMKSEYKGNSQLAERLILRLPNKQKTEKKKEKGTYM